MKVFRISNFLSLIVAGVLGVLLFWTSQAVQSSEEKLAEIKKGLMQEKDTIRVLSVEWDYLNNPQRLERLASEELGMRAASASEMVRRANEIPVPVIVPLSEFYEEGIAQNVSLDAAALGKPQAVVSPAKTDGKLAPKTAEKADFDRLIESLDVAERGGE